MKRLALYSTLLVAAGLIGSASAQNVIYITGSTAFRGNCTTIFSSQAGPPAGVFDAGSVTWCQYGSGTSGKGTWMLFHGTIDSVETYINCEWSGSEAGISSVSGQNNTSLNDGAPLAGDPPTFLVASTSVNPCSSSGTLNSAVPSGSQLETSSTQPDLSMSDTSQAVSLTPDSGASKCTDYGIIGIVPFVWAKGTLNSSYASWGRLVNINIPQANLLLAAPRTADFLNAGSAGGSYDYTNTVYLIGRNKGSGTRANTLIASSWPLGNPVTQWAVNSTVGTSGAGLYGLYYNGTASSSYSLTAIPSTPGDNNNADNGYETGGDVAKALGGNSEPVTVPTSGYLGPYDNQPALVVGYLAVSDLSTLTALTFNGVAESDGAIEEGTYGFYGHEHVLGKPTPTNPAATALVPNFFKAMKMLLDNNDVTPGTGDNTKKDPSTLHSTGILGYYLYADKGGQADTVYPVPGGATGYTLPSGQSGTPPYN
jgi:hypothetical protein